MTTRHTQSRSSESHMQRLMTNDTSYSTLSTPGRQRQRMTSATIQLHDLHAHCTIPALPDNQKPSALSLPAHLPNRSSTCRHTTGMAPLEQLTTIHHPEDQRAQRATSKRNTAKHTSGITNSQTSAMQNPTLAIECLIRDAAAFHRHEPRATLQHQSSNAESPAIPQRNTTVTANSSTKQPLQLQPNQPTSALCFLPSHGVETMQLQPRSNAHAMAPSSRLAPTTHSRHRPLSEPHPEARRKACSITRPAADIETHETLHLLNHAHGIT